MKTILLILTATTLLAEPVTKTPRHVSQKVKNEVYEAAGISPEARKNYVIDHQIPLELGGTNDKSNLQAQPKADAKRKDVLENKLTKEVKSGQKTVEQAKKELKDFHE